MVCYVVCPHGIVDPGIMVSMITSWKLSKIWVGFLLRT